MNGDQVRLAVDRFEAALDVYDEMLNSTLKTESELMTTATRMRYAKEQMLKLTFEIEKAVKD